MICLDHPTAWFMVGLCILVVVAVFTTFCMWRP